MRNRIFLKLLAAFAVVIAAATATLDISIRHAWEASLHQEIERNLRQKTLMLANRVNSLDETPPSQTKPDGVNQLPLQNTARQEAQASGARATIIDAQGRVQADSEADLGVDGESCHSARIRRRDERGVGTDTRRSRTVGTWFLYVAAPVSGGAVRLAYPLSDVAIVLTHVRHTLLLSSLLAFGVALVISGVAAYLTARRLQRIVDSPAALPAEIWPPALTKPRAMKSARSLPLWTRPPAIWKKASWLSRPASVSSKPCSTAWTMRSLR